MRIVVMRIDRNNAKTYPFKLLKSSKNKMIKRTLLNFYNPDIMKRQLHFTQQIQMLSLYHCIQIYIH